MKEFFVGLLAIFGLIIFMLALTWVIQGNDFFMYKFFAPKQEAVRREVFENTKSYTQGMIQNLRKMQFEYVQAQPDQKAALGNIILQQYADYPDQQLPPDLQVFMANLRNPLVEIK